MMAVDTAAKRFSMMGFGGPVPEMVIVPDGTTQVPEAHKRDVIIKMKSEAHAA